jgi:hypothetical protein
MGFDHECCDLAATAPGTCDSCTGAGRHELAGRARPVRTIPKRDSRWHFDGEPPFQPGRILAGSGGVELPMVFAGVTDVAVGLALAMSGPTRSVSRQTRQAPSTPSQTPFTATPR